MSVARWLAYRNRTGIGHSLSVGHSDWACAHVIWFHAISCLDNYLTMPQVARPKPIRLRRQIWRYTVMGWVLLGERDYLYPFAAVEFCRAWPARVGMRPQSSIRHPEHPGDHTGLACGSEV